MSTSTFTRMHTEAHTEPHNVWLHVHKHIIYSGKSKTMVLVSVPYVLWVVKGTTWRHRFRISSGFPSSSLYKGISFSLRHHLDAFLEWQLLPKGPAFKHHHHSYVGTKFYMSLGGDIQTVAHGRDKLQTSAELDIGGKGLHISVVSLWLEESGGQSLHARKNAGKQSCTVLTTWTSASVLVEKNQR